MKYINTPLRKEWAKTFSLFLRAFFCGGKEWSMNQGYGVIVIGAGAAGCSIAYHLF
ncbi:hypothetical protein ACQRBK_04545 [Peptoniphilaceae bacterium SGI.137]